MPSGSSARPSDKMSDANSVGFDLRVELGWDGDVHVLMGWMDVSCLALGCLACVCVRRRKHALRTTRIKMQRGAVP